VQLLLSLNCLSSSLDFDHIIRETSLKGPIIRAAHNFLSQGVFLNVEDASLVVHVFRVRSFRSEARILSSLGKRRMVEQANRCASYGRPRLKWCAISAKDLGNWSAFQIFDTHAYLRTSYVHPCLLCFMVFSLSFSVLYVTLCYLKEPKAESA